MKHNDLDKMLSDLGYESGDIGDTREISRVTEKLDPKENREYTKKTVEKGLTFPTSPAPSGRLTAVTDAPKELKDEAEEENKDYIPFTISPPPEALDIRDPEPLSEEERKKREEYLQELEEREKRKEYREHKEEKRRNLLPGLVMFAMVVVLILSLAVGILFSVSISVSNNPDYMLFSRRLYFAEQAIPRYEIEKGDLVVFTPVASCAELAPDELVLCGDGTQNKMAFVNTCNDNSVTIKRLNDNEETGDMSGLFVKGKYDSHSPFLGRLIGQLSSSEMSSLLFLLPLVLLILLPIYTIVRKG